jgi:microcystin-dependent protein
MTDPFVGEIRIFAGNFAPTGWALCNGQLLPIAQNTALFSLLGTIYGGNGTSNFALPNLQGAAPLMWGQGTGLSLRNIGGTGGETAVTLTNAQLPAHSHQPIANSTAAQVATPAGNTWAPPPPGAGRGLNIYDPSQGSGLPMNPQAVGVAGGGQPHNNMPPFLTFTFIIAMQGIYPPRA